MVKSPGLIADEYKKPKDGQTLPGAVVVTPHLIFAA